MANVRTLRSVDRESQIAAMEAEGLFVMEWTDAPAVSYPEHSHPHREVRVVLVGTMTVGAGGATYDLGAGDLIELDPGEPHWARVGPAGVTYLAGSTR